MPTSCLIWTGRLTNCRALRKYFRASTTSTICRTNGFQPLQDLLKQLKALTRGRADHLSNIFSHDRELRPMINLELRAWPHNYYCYILLLSLTHSRFASTLPWLRLSRSTSKHSDACSKPNSAPTNFQRRCYEERYQRDDVDLRVTDFMVVTTSPQYFIWFFL